MIKCPNCGSTAQFDPFEVQYHEDGEIIIVERWYRCDCGRGFVTATTYKSDADEKIIDNNI
jgi:DNA-directed RNA polymerase subunit RPC12/RpoP